MQIFWLFFCIFMHFVLLFDTPSIFFTEPLKSQINGLYRDMHFFSTFICVYQRFFVILHAKFV